MGFDQVGSDFREQIDGAPSHFVADRHLAPSSVVGDAAGNERADVLQQGTLLHPHVRQQGNILNVGVFDDTVVQCRTINAGGNRNATWSQNRAIKGRKLYATMKNGIVDPIGLKLQVDGDLAPILAIIAFAFKNGNFVGGEAAGFGGARLAVCHGFGKQGELRGLENFLELEQLLHSGKIKYVKFTPTMIPEYIAEQLQRYSSDYFIYPWSLFELRLQEEMIRTDRSGSPFYYVEFHFSRLPDIWPDSNDVKRFSSLLLQVAVNSARGSDIKGLLENDRGLGLVLLDSGVEGWHVFRQRLDTLLTKEAPEMLPQLEQWESTLVRFAYPEGIRTDSEVVE